MAATMTDGVPPAVHGETSLAERLDTLDRDTTEAVAKALYRLRPRYQMRSLVGSQVCPVPWARLSEADRVQQRKNAARLIREIGKMEPGIRANLFVGGVRG
jgi:hypothetical protein